ncbi:MAG: YitT family protein [Anaerorhabdus sp.]
MKTLKTKLSPKIIVLVTISALCYSYAINSFVEVADLFPGGFAGVSMLISRLLAQTGINISFSIIYLVLNLLVTAFVYRHVGKMFALYSVYWFSLTSIFTWIFPVGALTYDVLLLAVFGGIISGGAVALALRNNASSGGIDFIAVYVSSKYNRSTWNYVFLFNTGIILITGITFGWDKAFYSIIYQFCNTQVISSLHHRYKLKTLYIITESPKEVSDEILKHCRHGITNFTGEGMFSHREKNLLFMVVNAYQVHDVIEIIQHVDPHAFINIATTEKVVGNYYQLPLD